MPGLLQELGAFSATSVSSLVFFLLSTFLFLSAACYLRGPPKNKEGLRLPPSPPRLPLIGNLHQLSALPHRPLRELSRKYGPLMLLHLGQTSTLVVSSVEAAQEVLKTQDLAFANRPFSAAAAALTYGRRNVSFAPYGEHWRRAKKATVVHLLSPNKVQSLRRTREEEVALMIRKISSSPSTATVDLSEILYAFSNGLISRVVAGSCPAREVRTQRFREMIDESTAIISTPRLEELFPSLAWVTRLPGAVLRLKKLAKKFDVLLDEIMADHERRGEGGRREQAEEVDFLNLLLSANIAGDYAFSRDDLKAICIDLIAAGTDTSYVVLEWAMAELLKNPALLERTQREVREAAGGKPAPTEDDVASMPRLRAVVKEVLRLHMPAPLLVPREAMEATRVLGYDVPAGTRVFINAWAMATDPEWWEAPEEFRPERFLREEKAAPPADLRGSDFQFLPFGAGRRMCPGMNFALCEVELALASLLYCFDWSLPDGAAPEGLDMAESPGITVRRKTPLRLIAVPNSAVLA
ncbi:unnamed protein product [Spirodela intermedia]|uniref:Uncharacterized protein n=1 Tax=Spirodela intermedia TaxID=51605 RepID=A0A7I8L4E5_SPIIN|nr:unnamed protein product [Spirodela intermedia]